MKIKILNLMKKIMLFTVITIAGIMCKSQTDVYAYEYNGNDYSSVFDAIYYAEQYSDVRQVYGNNAEQLWEHFINYGIDEGRQGSYEFNVQSYRNRYADLNTAFGDNLRAYYEHYIINGKDEGRNGYVDEFSLVFDSDYYLNNNEDVRMAFGYNSGKALWHYINYGIYEGRMGNRFFDVKAYYSENPDLRVVFGNEYAGYVFHYIRYGKNENRKTTNADTIYSIDNDIKQAFLKVFDESYYLSNNADIKEVYLSFGANGALWHYINYGIKEGRRGSSWFDLNYYRESNKDLQQAYGNDLRAYAMHYAYYGYYEGRPANSTEADKPIVPDDRLYLKAGKIGIDVSTYQGLIDWDAVKASGEISFAIIRVGYGNDDISQDDDTALRNIRECERVGIPYGVYLFSYAVSEDEARSEVSHAIRMLNGHKPQLGVYIDIEATEYYLRHGLDPYSDEGRVRLTAYAKIFLNEMTIAGYKTGVYANVNYYNNVLLENELTGYKWIAGYGDFYDTCVEKGATMWQYTSSGKVTGISGNVDMNVIISDTYF